MEAVNILERSAALTWDYDEEADVLYRSVGEPGTAIAVDLGDGLVVRYDDAEHEVIGLTVIGLRER